jgi:endo-1,4-beta-xylanase
MHSPSSPRLNIAMGALSLLLACGRSSSTPNPSANSDDAAAGGSIAESGGVSGTTSQPAGGGTLTGGGTGSGGAWASGGAMPRGGDSGTGGRPGAGGVGKGGVSGTRTRDGTDAGGISSTGGANLGSGGTAVTSSTFAAGTGGAMARGGTWGLDGGASSGGTPATGGAPGTGGAIDAGSAGAVVFPRKFFGNLDTRGSIRSDFATYWDQFTPETAGYWASAQESPSTFRWTSLDAQYTYCEDNNIVFKESCFIWGAGPPSWINNNNAAELARNWMKAFCDRYPNTRVIDVVNEPLHGAPAYKEGLGGAGTSGWDWIVNSFKWAREACPNAILVLNDYNIIEYSSDHKKFIELINASLAAGAPIMAIGAQSHDVAKVSLSTVQTYLADLVSQTGLPVYITGMDLGIADDVQQATLMKDLVTTFWNDPNVPGITYWGYIAGATWRANTELITSAGTMRPAMTWLMDFLHR